MISQYETTTLVSRFTATFNQLSLEAMVQAHADLARIGRDASSLAIADIAKMARDAANFASFYAVGLEPPRRKVLALSAGPEPGEALPVEKIVGPYRFKYRR